MSIDKRLLAQCPYALMPLVLCVAICVANDNDPARTRAREKFYEHNKHLFSIEFGAHLFRSIRDEYFVPIDFDDLPDERPTVLRQTITGGPRRFLVDEAKLADQRIVEVPKSERYRDGSKTIDLIRPTDFNLGAYAAFDSKEADLLRFSWTFRGQNIQLLARLGAYRLDLDLREVEENPALDDYGLTPRERVIGYLSSLLRLEGKTNTLDPIPFKLEIPWPESFEEGVKFSSNPAQCITAMDKYFWFRRVDGYVHDGVLSLLFYTKPGQWVGFRDGSKWFPDEFRAWVHEQARLQGRLPENEDDR